MEIAEKINKLSSSWEEFKEKNSIDEYQTRLGKVEAYLDRPNCEKKSNNEYKANFMEYLKKGITNGNMSYMSDLKDGFPLDFDIAHQVTSILENLSVLRRICDVETISGDYMTYIYDQSNFKAEWSSVDSKGYTFNVDEFKLINVHTYPLYSQPKTTQNILDDSSIDIEKWLVERISVAFSKQENDSFINGTTDESKPTGILAYLGDVKDRPIEMIKCETQDIITFDDIIRLYYSLPTEYAVNGAFLMHRSTIQYLRSVKADKTDQYIWQPSFQKSVPDTLMGVPVYECYEMPDFVKGKATVIFADFKRGYKIIDRTGINIMRDPYSYKPYVSFYATKRVGGDVIDNHAIKVLTMNRAAAVKKV